MTRPLVSHVFSNELPGSPVGQMYDYIIAGNGLFVHARRLGLEALAPVTECEIRGLPPVTPFVTIPYPRVPWPLVESIVSRSFYQGIDRSGPWEALFYLWFDESSERWLLEYPPQVATASSVRLEEPDGGDAYGRALIEVHSHHRMSPVFSAADDADEVGCRLYAVVGSLFDEPTIRLRVGIFGYFWEIPARWIFELPRGLTCAVSKERGI